MISVVTAAIPERIDMLAECVASVRAQTLRPATHRISVDYERRGPGPVFASLVESTDTEWVTCFADDDVMQPYHLETMWNYVVQNPHVDVVWTYCAVQGRRFNNYNRPFDPEDLLLANTVSGTAMFRREVYDRAGGFRDEWAEDWRLWQRMYDCGATLKSIPVVTWTYRFHGQNLSRNELPNPPARWVERAELARR